MRTNNIKKYIKLQDKIDKCKNYLIYYFKLQNEIINFEQEIERAGFILDGEEVLFYYYHMDKSKLPGFNRRYRYRINHSALATFKYLLDKNKYDINFQPISNFKFAFRYVILRLREIFIYEIEKFI